MAKIEPISILRHSAFLDKISQSNEPVYVTKNGKAYLVILSPRQFEEIIQERDHFKQAFEKEREMQALIEKIKRSRENIDEGNVYTEEAFDRMMDDIL